MPKEQEQKTGAAVQQTEEESSLLDAITQATKITKAPIDDPILLLILIIPSAP